MSPSTSRDRVGLVVGGRYRLVATIGAGPNSTVHLADDVRLRRRVAVRLLEDAPVEDPLFVEAFTTGMRRVSSLRHPHVAMVHDWGIDPVPWVVGEYLAGGSLADAIAAGDLLSPSQTLQIGLAVARALAHAHEHGVVHRDLRPSDLLFDDVGRVKVTGFGLAAVYAQAAATRPMDGGAVAVRWASPEQARGDAVDGRSDVYTLVLVLVDALTGRSPFAADSVLASVTERVERPPSIPRSVGPMAAVLERASTVDPADRLDAAGLVTALMAVADAYPEPDPIVTHPPRGGPRSEGLVDTDITLVVLPDTDPPATGVSDEPPPRPDESSTGNEEDPAPTDDVPTGSAIDDDDTGSPGPAQRRRPAEAPADHDPDPAPGHPDPEPADGRPAASDRGRRGVRIAWVLLAVVLVAGGGVVGWIVWQAQRTPTHLIPSVTGRTADAARAELQELGYRVGVRHTRRDGTSSGQLLGVEPAPGTRVAEGRTVTLVVSDGQTLVTLPRDVVGATRSSALRRLRDLGVGSGGQEERWSEDVDAGRVVTTRPSPGERVERGSEVVLVISKGPEPRIVPSIDGVDPAGIEATLRDLGLVPERVERYDRVVDTGGLVGLDPAPGTSVPRGTRVTVVVSKGLLVAVPGLDGVTTVSEAIVKLQAAGLVANTLGGSGSLSGTPVAFDPPSGEYVAKGSGVDIVVR